jgi:hypothetical protein
MPPTLAAWAASLELSGLPDETAAIARSYLSRFGELTPVAREEFGRRIAAEVAARVAPPPPGTPAAAYLSAVLAERSSRDLARISRGGLGRPDAGPAAAGAGPGLSAARAGPRPSPTGAEAAAGPSGATAWPDRATARPGEAEALPGEAEALPGLPGEAEALPGEAEALPGEAEALPGGRFVPPA